MFERFSSNFRKSQTGFASMAVAAAALALAKPALAQTDLDSFFKGKQITMIVSSAPGGGYDFQGRLLARYMSRHLPGNPNIVVQNMPGATGVTAADYLATTAPKDGTTFGVLHREMLTAKLLIPKDIRFDITKFNWLGNIDSETGVVVAWHTSPLMTTDDLFNKEMIVGGTGSLDDDETLPRLLNTMIGTKFRVVSGYKGLNDVALAMQRGEVMGSSGWSWSDVKSAYAGMLADKSIRILMQYAEQRIADLPDIPSVLDYIKTDDDRRLMDLFLAEQTLARPLAAPPGVPPERVDALRAAFTAAIRDPGFIKDSQQAKLDLEPMTGEAVEGLVARVGALPQSVTDRMHAVITPN
jgi:tripartite-type tricarboxylate transporter receptor subunit TctC